MDAVGSFRARVGGGDGVEREGEGSRSGELDAEDAVGALADRAVVAGICAVDLAQLAIDGIA